MNKDIMKNIIMQIFGNAEEKYQSNISKLESNVILLYGELVNEFPRRKAEEEKLAQFQAKTSDFFNKNQDLLSAYGNIKKEKQMKTSMFAYRAIPLIDALLALYPLSSIIESEWTNIPVLKFLLALLVGLFISMIGRWTANELIGKTGDKRFAYICVLIVPLTYWIDFIGYNNGNLFFTIVFSLISVGIQSFIIYFFPNLHHAISYAEAKTTYENLLKLENKQIQILAEQVYNFSRKFYVEVSMAYHNLIIAFQSYTDKFGKNPNIALKQTLLCVCNLAFYNYEAIPYRRRNGQIEGASIIIDMPEISDLFMSDEVRFFAYMLKQAGRNSRLTELIPQISSTHEISLDKLNETTSSFHSLSDIHNSQDADSEQEITPHHQYDFALSNDEMKQQDDESQEFAIW